MSLAFSARQELTLPVSHGIERLPTFLNDETRVMNALFDPAQLTPLGGGHYRYAVTQVKVFQLCIQPVVELQVRLQEGRVDLKAVDCQLEGLGLVDDFQLGLDAWMAAGEQGLEGEAALNVTVSRPPLLKLIPSPVLEATGRSVLSGILLTIKSRVGKQLLGDFRAWCQET